MKVNNTAVKDTRRVQDGYMPKGYITQVVQGKEVHIPVSQLNIIPPKSGTAAVTPKN